MIQSIKNHKYFFYTLAGFLMLFLNACNRIDPPVDPPGQGFQTTPYNLNLPPNVPPPIEDPTNPLTEEGVSLGRKLFYDEILSANNSMSCASCHKQEYAFTDPARFSVGVDGIAGNRNSMAIFNQAWNRDFFWNGRKSSIKDLVFEPVTNPIELHLTWHEAIDRIKLHNEYPALFAKAFNIQGFEIDSVHVAKAIAQFMNSIISFNSKYDKFVKRQANLSPAEERGFEVFKSEAKGDCFHCHVPSNQLLTDNAIINPIQRFHNTGLDPLQNPFTGKAEYTNNPMDNGKFKTPSLRNLAFTAPYMHDGRFQTLDEVIEFYDNGVVLNDNLDLVMLKDPTRTRTFEGGKRQLNLTAQEKADLKAFLLTLTDSSLITNPKWSDPD